MNVTFKNGKVAYNCTEPTEQKVYRAGIATGWILVFSIEANLTSTDIDAILTEEAISEMVFASETASYTLRDYSKVSSCIVKYKENSTVVELQFTKGV